MAARRTRKSRKGFSLAETLVAVLILGLLSSAAALGVSQALWQRNKSIALADAQSVASTTAQLITDQLRYGRVVQGESGGETILLFSGIHNTTVRIQLDGDGYLVTQSADGGKTYAMLGQDAYCGLRLSGLEFDVSPASGDTVEKVDVTLGVAQADGTELWSLDFSVAPVNPQRFTVT